MRSKFILSLLAAALLGTTGAGAFSLPQASAAQNASAASQNANPQSQAESKAKQTFAGKYPHAAISSIRTADLNGDGRYETFILTESGSFFLVNAKGYVVLVHTDILSDESFDKPAIQVFSVTPKEKQVAVTFNFAPSNTMLYAYRLQNGTLVKKLEVMGDQGAEIDGKGRVHQYWKHYLDEGGWDPAEALYTWSVSKQKYIGSGMLP